MVIDHEMKDRQKRPSIFLTRFSEKDNKNNGMEQILRTIIPFFSVKKKYVSLHIEWAKKVPG